MFNRRGSLQIEALVSLLIYAMITSILVNILVVLSRKRELNWYYFDIGCMQLQELIAASEIVEVNEDSLILFYNKEEYTIEEHNGRIVKRPGYQIMMNNIEDISFELVDETVMMRGMYQNEEFEVAIGKKEWWR